MSSATTLLPAAWCSSSMHWAAATNVGAAAAAAAHAGSTPPAAAGWRRYAQDHTSSSSSDGAAGGTTQQQQQQQEEQQRLLTVAVVGLPNAGKSTLVNRLVGAKISGVSSKRNTTINPQLGSFTVGSSQVLLYDTPGLVDRSVQGSPVERLRSAWATAAMTDQLLLIVDAEQQFRLREPALLKLAEQLAAGPPDVMQQQRWVLPPCLLFLNKQDKLPQVARATVMQQLRRQLGGVVEFQAVFEGAAMRGEGVAALKDYLIQQARPGAWLMRPQQAHAATPGELAVELVREKLYRRLNQELPYRLSVVLQSVAPDTRDTRHGPGHQALVIKVDVFVKNRLTKSIVVGKGGSVIQRYVAEPTQGELARALGVPVQLLVFVKTLSE